MPTPRILVAATIVAVALAACSKESIEPVAYSPVSDPSVVLKHEGIAWSLIVDNKDVTKDVGLVVKQDPSLGEILFPVQLTKTTLNGLPAYFQLQENGIAQAKCLECNEALKSWKRTGPKASH
jgi:hypothetical protein